MNTYQICIMILISIFVYSILTTFIYIRLKLEKKQEREQIAYINTISSLKYEILELGSYIQEIPEILEVLVLLDNSLVKLKEGMDYIEFKNFKKNFSKDIQKYYECLREANFYNLEIKCILECLNFDTDNFY